MNNYFVDDRIFQMFPAFRRGVLIARGVDNSGSSPEIAELLLNAAMSSRSLPPNVEQERLDPWNRAFLKFGADPNKHTPSIRFLREQIHRGKLPRSINKVVDLFKI